MSWGTGKIPPCALDVVLVILRFDMSEPFSPEQIKALIRLLDDDDVNVKDHVIGRPVEIETDMLTLATAVIPNRDDKLANFFKVPVNDDGFFIERHAKLGPSEFATDGVFWCYRVIQ